MLLAGQILFAQNVALTFDNGITIEEGGETLYQVEVYITSDTDFVLGPGQFYLDYDTSLFNTRVVENNNITVITDGSILGSQSFNVDNYSMLQFNDRFDDTVSFNWNQFWSSGTIGASNVLNTPSLLCTLRFAYNTAMPINVDRNPEICFNVSGTNFDDQFMIACGPEDATPAGADCTQFPAEQIFDYDGSDCTGAIAAVDYIWQDTDSWFPASPNNVTLLSQDNIIVVGTSPTALEKDMVVNDLTTNENTLLTTSGIFSELTVNGSISHNGSLFNIPNINFVGTESESFSGSSDIDFNVLTLSGSGTLNLDTGITIREVLNPNGTTLNTNGNLTLQSLASGTAMVSELTGGSINGDVTVERFIPGKRAYRFVSSAVTTTTSINANWQEGVNNTDTDYANNMNPSAGFGTHITGSMAGENGFDATTTGNSSLFQLDKDEQVFVAVENTNTSNGLTAGDPYLLFIRGSRNVNMSSNDAIADDTRLRATGTLATGANSDNSERIAPNDGEFGLFGNPYQATVDINNVAINDLDTSEYFVYDPNIGERGSYVMVTLPAGTNMDGSEANQYLQPGQGFMMATLNNVGPTVVIFEEDDKVVGEDTNVFFTDNDPLAQDSRIFGRLYRADAFANGDSHQDSFGVLFNDNYNNSYTTDDVLKPTNIDENMGVAINNKELKLSRQFNPSEADEIQLFNKTYRDNSYTLSLEVIDMDNVSTYLVDNFSNEHILLNAGINYYDFVVDNDIQQSIAEDRFKIVFQEEVLSNTSILGSEFSIYPNPIAGDEITITAPMLEAETVMISLTNVLGQKVLQISKEFMEQSIQISNLGNLQSGVYFLSLEVDGQSITKQLIKE